MPVQKVNKYLKWKSNFEKEKQRLMDDAQGIIKV
jgi:hypothetical protein